MIVIDLSSEGNFESRSVSGNGVVIGINGVTIDLDGESGFKF